MRIIYDNIIYSLQKSGGGSIYWAELSKRLNRWKGGEAIFYDQKEPNENIARKDLEFINLKIEKFLTLKIRRYLNFTEPILEKSIFHSSYFRISKSPNAINVTTIHDFTTEKFRKGLARRVNLWQKKYAVKNSQGIVCISENTKRDLLAFIPEVDEKKVRVIYNGISDDFFHIVEPFTIASKDVKFEGLENRKYLLYIGHRTSYKNFELALEAVALVQDRYKLVVVGEPFTKEEKKKVKVLGDRCVQLSKLNNMQLNYLYNNAFALLYPSSYEGFGIPVAEAMKTGCPVIAFNKSSIPEVAGEAALLYDDISVESIVDGIGRLEDEELREGMIKKGFRQSERFSWDDAFEKYISFYEELYNIEV
ncbi:glycosyltransferase family 4 protein [Riemerella anatipestifer]|uniref:glycosyltransferase family 4 protein n=1 Tax=Riemerella anatipestifer TaxID=34085 RepID=UPI0013751312|nr:glycosyltransferase family 1 protein [Riemerella anatipestifer]